MCRESAIQGGDVRFLVMFYLCLYDKKVDKTKVEYQLRDLNAISSCLAKSGHYSFCFSKRECIYCKPERLEKLLDDKMDCEIS